MAEKNVVWSLVILIFHVFCALIGIAALGIGVYVYVNSSKYSSGLHNCSIPLIVIGIVVVCLHTCGFWSAHKNGNRRYRIIFAVFIVLLALGLALMAALTYAVKEETIDILRKTVDRNFNNAVKESKEDLMFVEAIQKYGECCGIDGPNFWKEKSLKYPKSCCPPNVNTCSEANVYQIGCKEEAAKVFSVFIDLIIISVLVMAVFEVISAFMVAVFMKKTRIRGFRPVLVYSRANDDVID
uniref:Unkown protein n=1 Tax=Riptortus pedestris TaxID=329032 RepID=R4WP81_RIPPE|nr:unkown protein [Riptortus pedestris]